MRLALWLLLAFARLFGCRILGMTIDGRSAYDHLRVATGGDLEKATDGLTFRWKGCRFGYEPSKDELSSADPDGVNCSWCGEKWHHTITRIDSKGRVILDRTPAERCETCARKTAERRGVPWETIR